MSTLINERTKSQNKQLLEMMERGEKITAIDALNKVGCFRLSGRIWDLIHDGHDIKKEWVWSGKKKFARYYIEKKKTM